MHCLGSALPARSDDLFNVEVALRGGWRPDCDCLIGHLHMKRITICIRIDRDRRDAHAPRGFDYAAGDLAAIGNQDSFEHAIMNSATSFGGLQPTFSFSRRAHSLSQ